MSYLLLNTTTLILANFFPFDLPCVSGLTSFFPTQPLPFIPFWCHMYLGMTSFGLYFKVSHAQYLCTQSSIFIIFVKFSLHSSFTCHLEEWDVPYCILLLGEGTFSNIYPSILMGLMGYITSWLYFHYYVLWSWIVCPTVTDALRSDSLMTTLVLPLLCLVCLYMNNDIMIIRGTSSLQITSLVMITLFFPFVLDPIWSCTDKTHVPTVLCDSWG